MERTNDTSPPITLKVLQHHLMNHQSRFPLPLLLPLNLVRSMVDCCLPCSSGEILGGRGEVQRREGWFDDGSCWSRRGR